MKIQEACADSGYDTTLSTTVIRKRGINFYTPERTEQKRGTTEFQGDFQYDEKDDRFICPGGKTLPLHGLNRTINTVQKSTAVQRLNVKTVRSVTGA